MALHLSGSVQPQEIALQYMSDKYFAGVQALAWFGLPYVWTPFSESLYNTAIPALYLTI